MLAIKLKDATLEQVKEQRTDLYDAVYALGVEATNEEKDEKIAGLTKQVTEFEKEKAERIEKETNEKLIRDSAKKLGQIDKGEELIAKGTSVQEALTVLINANEDKGADAAAAFAATAPAAAGDPSSSELDLEQPKNQEQARQFCMKKYNCTKKDAWRHARSDFSELFGFKVSNNAENGGK